MPQGDGDGLWALIFVILPVIGAFAGVAAAVASAIGNRSETDRRMDMTTTRVAALVVDALVFGAVAFLPLRALSAGGNGGVGFVVGLVAAIAYLGAPVAVAGATVGHRVVGLHVVRNTGERPTVFQAVSRSIVILAELLVGLLFFGLIFIPELISIGRGHAAFADALCRTRVVPRRSL